MIIIDIRISFGHQGDQDGIPSRRPGAPLGLSAFREREDACPQSFGGLDRNLNFGPCKSRVKQVLIVKGPTGVVVGTKVVGKSLLVGSIIAGKHDVLASVFLLGSVGNTTLCNTSESQGVFDEGIGHLQTEFPKIGFLVFSQFSGGQCSLLFTPEKLEPEFQRVFLKDL